jgi:hypothetical protein
MKTGWLILTIAALLGLAAFGTRLVLCKTDTISCAACAANSGDARTALAWMETELDLSEAEFAKVCTLHKAYLPKCDAMCQRMAVAGSKLTTLLAGSNGMTPEADAALREYETLRAECQRATLRHLTDTAALMKPEAGRAYMQKVLPHLFVTHQHVSEVTR